MPPTPNMGKEKESREDSKKKKDKQKHKEQQQPQQEEEVGHMTPNRVTWFKSHDLILGSKETSHHFGCHIS